MMHDQEVMVRAAHILKEHGIKSTPQRQAILSCLLTSTAHPTIDMIYDYVKKNGLGVSLATVYNTLELLLKTGIVIEVENDNNGHVRYDYYGKPHYHVICTRCNRIVDVFDDSFRQFESAAKQATGFKVENSQYEVYGLCPDCQRALGADN